MNSYGYTVHSQNYSTIIPVWQRFTKFETLPDRKDLGCRHFRPNGRYGVEVDWGEGGSESKW
ncbi:uncharacterized protein PgNI_06913 [Pyricularia grisea]|uniref:Uncharacterized protein n=1 Tax=Pyricularia grisea TaxID=148305 RepID=A0A6P8B1P3_PYRGI|nr:uncharacterized protein PgNI_06913 [Pyricularia grisea]TLD08777.1 hypothetical protein PgNI_06913 [Pyricularia grisea]